MDSADDKFRHRVCDVLREKKAHDVNKTALRTRDLARGLVNHRWQHIARLNDEQQRQYDSEVQKMVIKLDNAARVRTKNGQEIKGKLSTLCELLVPAGTGEHGQLMRFWYIPRPLADDPSGQEPEE